MKRFNLKFCFLLTALLLLVGCQSDPLDSVQEADTTSETAIDFSISEENAVANLLNFISLNGISRSEDSLNIESIIPITIEFPSSRASIEASTTIAYAVNFTKEDGYAVVAADSRIGSSILSIVEKGSVNDSLIVLAAECISEVKYYYDGYPKDKPMFFEDPDVGDETFFNPNASDFIDKESDEKIVGNFSDDDSYYGYDSSSKNGKISFQNRLKAALPLSMTLEYAIDQIKACGGHDWPDKPYVIKPADPFPTQIDVGGWGVIPASYGAWEIVKKKDPLLTAFVHWWQKEPFNDYYPNRRKYIIIGHSHKAPAGCFPLAIAKIMAYFKYPKTKPIYNDYCINWESLQYCDIQDKKPVFAHPAGSDNAAKLLKGIAEGCHCLYFYSGTFTFPSNATSYLRKHGFQGAHNKDYSFDLVTQMLDVNRPLIVYALPGINIFKSHCWNIDGYQIKTRRVTEYDSHGVVSKVYDETSNMVHCDFGWGGNGNGYYESGIFKSGNGRNELDYPSVDTSNFNYNHYKHLITYGSLDPAYM